MSRLDQWFAKEKRRLQSRSEIVDTMISGKWLNYFWYRFRLFAAARAFFLAIHLAETIILSQIFTLQHFFTIVVFKNIAFAIRHFWWGSLEIPREQIRIAHDERQFKARDLTIVSLHRSALTIACAGLVFILTYYVYLKLKVGHIVSVFDAMFLVIAFRLCFDILRDTYHTGAFAVRRVFRPLIFSFIVESLSLVGVFVVFDQYGPWAFPLASFLSGMAGVGVVWFFVSRAYREIGLPRFQFKLTSPLKLFKANNIPAGLANTLVHSSALLGTVMVLKNSGQIGPWIYLCWPLLLISHQWAQLIYFDYKKINFEVFYLLRPAFLTASNRFAIAVGAVSIGICIMLLGLVREYPPATAIVGLAGFLILRSVTSQYQVFLFSLRRLTPLLILGFLELGLLLWIFNILPNTTSLLWILMGTQIVILLALKSYVKQMPFSLHLASHRGYGLSAWYASLLKRVGSTQLTRIQIGKNASEIGVKKIADELVKKYGDALRVAMLSRNTLLFYSEDPKNEPDTEDLIVVLGGLATAIERLGPFADGSAALQALELLSEPGVKCLNELKTRFEEKFKEVGFQVEISNQYNEKLNREYLNLNLGERLQILHLAKNNLKGKKSNSKFKYDVTVATQSQNSYTLFVLPKSVDSAVRHHWKDLVLSANIYLGK